MMSVLKKGNGALSYSTLLSVLNGLKDSTAALIDHSLDFWSWLKPCLWPGLKHHTEVLHWRFEAVAGNESKEMKDRTVRVVCNSACGVHATGSEHLVKSVFTLDKDTGAYMGLPDQAGPRVMRPFSDDDADAPGAKGGGYHKDVAKVTKELMQLPASVLLAAGTSSAAVETAWSSFVGTSVPPGGVATNAATFRGWSETRSVWPLPWMIELKAARRAAATAAGSTATAGSGGGSSINGVPQPLNHPAALGAPIVTSQDPTAAVQAANRTGGHDAVNYTFQEDAPRVLSSKVHLVFTPYAPYLWPAKVTSNAANNGKEAALFWGSELLEHSVGCSGDRLGDVCNDITCPLSKARDSAKCVAVRWYDLADTPSSSSDDSSASSDSEVGDFGHIDVGDDARQWAQAAIDGKTGHRGHPLAAAAPWQIRQTGSTYGSVTDPASAAPLSRVETWRVGPEVKIYGSSGKLHRQSQKIYAASLVKLLQDKFIV